MDECVRTEKVAVAHGADRSRIRVDQPAAAPHDLIDGLGQPPEAAVADATPLCRFEELARRENAFRARDR